MGPGGVQHIMPSVKIVVGGLKGVFQRREMTNSDYCQVSCSPAVSRRNTPARSVRAARARQVLARVRGPQLKE